MRTICAVTATRAEYGLLRPVLQKLAARIVPASEEATND